MKKPLRQAFALICLIRGQNFSFLSLRASAPLREISVMKGTTPAADPVFAAGVTYLCDMTRETNLIKNNALL